MNQHPSSALYLAVSPLAPLSFHGLCEKAQPATRCRHTSLSWHHCRAVRGILITKQTLNKANSAIDTAEATIALLRTTKSAILLLLQQPSGKQSVNKVRRATSRAAAAAAAGVGSLDIDMRPDGASTITAPTRGAGWPGLQGMQGQGRERGAKQN